MWFDDIDVMTEEHTKFKADGGGAVIDVTCHGWEREPLALKALSERMDVHLIACTGFYVED